MKVDIWTEAKMVEGEKGYYIHPTRFGYMMKACSRAFNVLMQCPEIQLSYKECEICLETMLRSVQQLSFSDEYAKSLKNREE